MNLRRTLAAALSVVAVILKKDCAGDDVADDDNDNPESSGGGQVTLASQSFDEAALVTAMYQLLLEDAGYEVETKLVDTRPAYLSEFPDAVDIVPEYAAGLADGLNLEINGEDAGAISTGDLQETIDAMTPLLEEKGISLLETSEAFSANGYFVTQDYSDDEGVTALSDLDGKAITLAAAEDCTGRGDCEAGLIDVYGIDVTLLGLGYASPQTFQAVQDGEAQVGQTSTLDVTLEDQGLLMLEDDRNMQPAQNLVPAVSTSFLEDNPEVEEPLNALMGALDNETLGELLVRVTVDRETPEDVARSFLEDEGLL